VRALFIVARADRTMPRTAAALRYREAPYLKHYVDFDGDFATYMAGFRAKRRQELRRNLRHFDRPGQDGSTWREYRTVADVADFVDLAVDVSTRTPWNGRYRNAVSASDAETFRREARRDNFRGYILFHQDRPVAYNYCHALGGILIGNKMGFAQDYRKHAPGNVLLCLMIEHLFRTQEFRRLDFGRGAFTYKETFANGSMACRETFYFRAAPGNALLLAHTRTMNLLSRVARRMARGLGLRSRVGRGQEDVSTRV
jgi:CelD/BcsL family acetyltransferase involved in cellulose biosynthesis